MTLVSSSNSTSDQFIGSPVMCIVNMASSDFPSESTLRTCCVKVVCNGQTYIFSEETDNDQQVRVDISSALRAAMSSRTPLSELTASSIPTYAFSVYGYVMYMLEGVLTTTEASAITLGTGSAHYGMLTELERYQGTTLSSLSKCSTKPATGERCPNGHILIAAVPLSATYSRHQLAKDTDGTSVSFDSRTVLIDTESDFSEFLFVNQRGALEDACAVSLASLTHDHSDRSKYNAMGIPSFTPSPSIRSTRTQTRAIFAMSSGFVNRDWAEWWSGEFLASDQHWLKVGAQYLPVTITPKNDKTTIYDTANPDALHIDFTVELALKGRP